MADYYELLGVSRQATTAEIRKAYALIARDKHPDRFHDPEEKKKAEEYFKEATAAFNALCNDKSRQAYDREVSQPKVTDPLEIASEACARALTLIEARDLYGLIRRVVEAMPAKLTRGNRLARVRGELHGRYSDVFATLAPDRGRIAPGHPLGIWPAPSDGTA